MKAECTATTSWKKYKKVKKNSNLIVLRKLNYIKLEMSRKKHNNAIPEENCILSILTFQCSWIILSFNYVDS